MQNKATCSLACSLAPLTSAISPGKTNPMKLWNTQQMTDPMCKMKGRLTGTAPCAGGVQHLHGTAAPSAPAPAGVRLHRSKSTV